MTKLKRMTQLDMLELVLEDLEKWIDGGDSDCSMQYAYRHGYYLHAANLWLGSGAASDEVYSKTKSLKIPRKMELDEINRLCDEAYIYICPDCNHHAFLDYDEGKSIQCSSCLKTAHKENRK